MATSLRSSLLPFTIQNAARLKFYRELWDGLDYSAIRTPEDLPALPAFGKQVYKERYMFDPEVVGASDICSHSTGTTGTLTWRHRSRMEVQTIAQLMKPDLARQAEGEGRGGPVAKDDDGGVALVMQYTRHGMSLPVPGQSYAVPISVADDIELAQCLQMLTTTYHLGGKARRATRLAGSAHDLALLAQAWIEAGRPGPLTLRTLYVGGFADAGLRRFLVEVFDGPLLVEKFSLSEVFGGATRVYPGTAFTMDPFVLSEVVDEDSRPVAADSVGELCLTELFPLIQLQPLVRYRTGDIVRLVEHAGDLTRFEWIGRRSTTARDSDGVWCLGFRQLADGIAEDPRIAREDYRPNLSLRGRDMGALAVRITEVAPGQAEILLGLRINPWMARAEAEALVSSVWVALRDAAGASAPRLSVALRLRPVPGLTTDFRALSTRADLALPARRLSEPPPAIFPTVKMTTTAHA